MTAPDAGSVPGGDFITTTMPADKFIMAGGFATRLRLYGFDDKNDPTRPVAFLLHGYLESLDVWDGFVPQLKDYRVMAIDIPGHGISEIRGDIHTMEMMAGVVIGAADHMKVEKFFLAGHSMGGYVACETIARYPERLSGLVMFHSTPDADSPDKSSQRQREIDLVQAGKKDLLAMTVEGGFAQMNRGIFADFIEGLREGVVLTEEQGIVNLLRGMMQRRDRSETLRKSSVPQLFIMGELDRYIPLDLSRKLEQEHPQARFKYLTRSGHMGFVEEPETAAGIITDFMAEHV